MHFAEVTQLWRPGWRGTAAASAGRRWPRGAGKGWAGPALCGVVERAGFGEKLEAISVRAKDGYDIR